MRGLFFVALLVLVAGCYIEPAPPPPAAPPPPRSRVVRASAPAPAPPVRVAARRASVEVGYQFCCGNDRYRLDIGCSYLELRCYQRTELGWVRTYGRFCKEELGAPCYPNGCDEVCR